MRLTTIPVRFEDYLAMRGLLPADPDLERCSGCIDGTPVITNDGNCETCMRYQFGYDQAEAAVARAMLGGAVTAALEAGVPSEIIRAAVNDALDDTTFAEGRMMGERKQRAGVS